jgi:hypothetical protein
MIRRVLRVVLLLGMIGTAGWYVWYGLTAPGDEFTTPWEDAIAVPIVVGSLVLPIWLVLGIVGTYTGTRNSSAMRTAPLGIGTITGYQRTNLSVGERPVMEIGLTVRTADGQVFDSVARQTVDLTELHLIVPGTHLPVRYLPGDNSKVEIDHSGDRAQIQAVQDQVMIRAGLTTPRGLHIAANGVQTRAVVSAVRPTGRLVQDNPQLTLTLLVTRLDGSSFEVTTDKVISAPLVGLVQIGSVVTAYYLPGVEDDISIQLPANPHV